MFMFHTLSSTLLWIPRFSDPSTERNQILLFLGNIQKPIIDQENRLELSGGEI
jgi:hypothetical protein